MKSLKEIESVGWGFFVLCFAVLVAPTVWFVWNGTYDTVPASVRILMGLVVASTEAGIVAWVVNDQLHRRNVRRYEAKRAEERKESRRKGKGKRKKK